MHKLNTNIIILPIQQCVHFYQFVFQFCTWHNSTSFAVPCICHWNLIAMNFRTNTVCTVSNFSNHDDIIKWKHFPCYSPFVRAIYLSPVNSLHKGQWRGALVYSLICTWINGWVNNHEALKSQCHKNSGDCDLIKSRAPFTNLKSQQW